MRALPKVLLHDHLDGGLRPQTVLDLARAVGHTLPETEADALGRWFVTAACGSLTAYLATFEHTVAVLQTADALHRVAREAVEDLAEDGVVAAELRYAPELHLAGGLSLDDVVLAVREGLAEGAAATGLRVGQILCAMRQHDRSEQIAELAVRHRDSADGAGAGDGAGARAGAGAVVGFDLAGPELGFSPGRADRAFAVLREADLPCTLHAGEEGSGPEAATSLAESVHAGACRLGHGVRLVDQLVWPDAVAWPDRTSSPDQVDWLGDTDAAAGSAHADTVPRDQRRQEPPRPATTLAHWVRDRGIALEMCPSSNVSSGAAASIATHPATALLRAGFAVTVNTDNRLQSGTSLSRELALLVDQAGWSLDDVRDVTLTAARSAFSHRDERDELVATITGPSPGAPGGRHRA
ncbi:MAG: adenosine deaminase family protein [Cellulomonas sp.]|jgi:adenosine deaminase|nr:adenosine deaminase family protein [Cellulomonas sp.]